MRKTSQRREQLLEMMGKLRSVKVTDLVQRLNVSAVTIRTDLSALEKQGLLTRKYGGATLTRLPPPEQSISQKDALNVPLKELIGVAAASLVEPGDNIIIDSGTTTQHMARHLFALNQVVVMTNGLNIAWELADAPGVQVMLTGGLLHRQSLSLQGAQAEACLDAYSFDKLFLGVDGFDLQFGLTTHHEAEASLNQRMVERAKKVVVLTDASKFGRVGLHRIVLLNRVHTVITDSGISPEYCDGLQRMGIEVMITP